jgi:hypothetical protein
MSAATPRSPSPAPPLWLPVLAATLAPGLAIAIWSALRSGSLAGAWMALFFVSVVAAAHVLVLGIPYALWMHRIGRFHAWTMVLGGFFAGGLPLGLLIARDGEAFAFFGGMGVISALAFYVVSWALERGRRNLRAAAPLTPPTPEASSSPPHS